MMKTSKSELVADRGERRRPQGVLLDLDQTLVLTSRIAHLRDSRRWKDVSRSMGETSLPPGTRQFLEEVSRVGPIGVVTSSPRSYAEKLLRHHAIEVPVLVAYHDVARRKPHPDPLLRAAADLGLPPDQCVYVGDADVDILAAVAAGVVPLGITWEGDRPQREILARARAWCATWEEVLDALTQARSREAAT